MPFHSATPPTSPDETIQISRNPFYQSAPHNSCQNKQIGFETSRIKSSLLPTPPRTKNASRLFAHSSRSEISASYPSSSPPTPPETERPSFSPNATRVSRSAHRPTMSFELAPALENGLCPPPEIVEFSRLVRSKRDTSSCVKPVSLDNPFLLTSSFTPPLYSPADSTASADSLPIASSSLDIPDYFTFSPSSSSRIFPDATRQQASSPPLIPLRTPPAESSQRPKRSMPTRERKQLVRNTDPKKGPIWDEANPFLKGIGMIMKNEDESESESGSENESDIGSKSSWLRRQRIGEAHEKQTIGYVFRGTKTTFANPHYNHSQPSPSVEHPITHPDYSPPSNPRPRLLFPVQTTPRRPTVSLSSRLQSMTRTSARPVFASYDDDDDDDNEGLLMATPRKSSTSAVPTNEQFRSPGGSKRIEAPRWSLSESTPRSERTNNTTLVDSADKGLDTCQKKDIGLQRKPSVSSVKRGSESIGIDILGSRNVKRLRC
ncbi:hypothetical protein [Phaffia rhodozyma]|uniref:Uncharacterized protein n=1 Tax=Phaffia rhodozyma TaxID=264483 RepID=A0A0F7SLV9_PHARH|nr:hypothetical protein [Phaffia rhodozyma]